MPTKGTKPAAKPIETKAKGKPQVKAEKPATAPQIKLSMPITASASEINKAIVSIGTRGKKLDSDMHSAACASLHHVTLHGDTTLINRLVLAMPQAARRNALVVWAQKFGMVALNDDAKTREAMPLVYAKELKANIEQAQQEPFFQLKNVREGTSEWLYMDFIGSVMKTLEKHAKADPKGANGSRAHAALKALQGINEAAEVQPVGVLPPDVDKERRGVAVH